MKNQHPRKTDILDVFATNTPGSIRNIVTRTLAVFSEEVERRLQKPPDKVGFRLVGGALVMLGVQNDGKIVAGIAILEADHRTVQAFILDDGVSHEEAVKLLQLPPSAIEMFDAQYLVKKSDYPKLFEIFQEFGRAITPAPKSGPDQFSKN